MFTGKQIRDKRKAEKLSAEALAMKLGVDKENLYKWEKGTKPSDPEDFIKISNWLENVPRGIGSNSKNGSAKPTDAQNSPQDQKPGLDLIKEVNRLNDQQITIDATISVILSEIVPLISKATGRSHASVFSQMKKDVLTEISNLKTLMDKK